MRAYTQTDRQTDTHTYTWGQFENRTHEGRQGTHTTDTHDTTTHLSYQMPSILCPLPIHPWMHWWLSLRSDTRLTTLLGGAQRERERERGERETGRPDGANAIHPLDRPTDRPTDLTTDGAMPACIYAFAHTHPPAGQPVYKAAWLAPYVRTDKNANRQTDRQTDGLWTHTHNQHGSTAQHSHRHSHRHVITQSPASPRRAADHHWCPRLQHQHSRPAPLPPSTTHPSTPPTQPSRWHWSVG